MSQANITQIAHVHNSRGRDLCPPLEGGGSDFKVAIPALIRFFSSMNQIMPFQITLLVEFFSTNIARKHWKVLLKELALMLFANLFVTVQRFLPRFGRRLVRNLHRLLPPPRLREETLAQIWKPLTFPRCVRFGARERERERGEWRHSL